MLMPSSQQEAGARTSAKFMIDWGLCEVVLLVHQGVRFCLEASEQISLAIED